MQFLQATPHVPMGDLDRARPYGFHAPAWARYVVADRDGSVWAFERCPTTDPDAQAWRNTADGGRFGLVGSRHHDIPHWEATLFFRRGGLWISALDAERIERRRRLIAATATTLRFVAFMSLVVAALLLGQCAGIVP
jgi:hypothetical protein